MNRASSVNAIRSVPKNSQKRLSYSEDVNEASGALQDEAVDFKRETADRGNQAIERTEPDVMTAPTPPHSRSDQLLARLVLTGGLP